MTSTAESPRRDQLSQPPSSSATTLPADFYPPDWHTDAERTDVLFAPFRARALNPINYDSKLLCWTQLIERYCSAHKGAAHFTLAELRAAFAHPRHPGRQSHALGTVVRDMLAAGSAQPADAFNRPAEHTWRAWAHGRLTAAAGWLQSPIRRAATSVMRSAAAASATAAPLSPTSAAVAAAADADDIDPLEVFVSLEAVRLHAAHLQRCSAVAGRVLSMEQLIELVAGAESADVRRLTAAGVRLAVHQLHCTRRAAVSSWQPPTMGDDPSSCGRPVQLVRITPVGDEADVEVPQISEVECSVYAVQQAVRRQEELIGRLAEEQERADRLTRQLVHEKRSLALAKVQLRKRKQLERKIASEAEKLLNLETMLASIEDSKQSANVIGAYKLATNALRDTNAASGLSVDAVHDVLDEVRDAIDDHREIEQALGEKQTPIEATGADDGELERELAELMAADEAAGAATATTTPTVADDELNASIERRLKQLNISGFADLSVAEQEAILEQSATPGERVAEVAK